MRQPYLSLLSVAVALAGCSGFREPHPIHTERYRAQKRLAAEHASLDRLRTALSNLESFHREHDTRAASRLAAGLSAEEIRERTARLPSPLPGELVALYEWHNGTTGGCDAVQGPALVAYHCFLSLDEALAAQNSEASLYGFPERWFPILYHQEEYLYVVCDDAEDPALPVFHRLLESGDTAAFTNLRTLVETYVEAGRRGHWHPDTDDQGGWHEFEAIRRRRNPNTDPPWSP